MERIFMYGKLLVILVLASCASVKNKSNKKIEHKGKYYSFYNSGNEGRIPAQQEVLAKTLSNVHPLKSIVKNSPSVQAKVLEDANLRLGKTYKSIDEISGADESALTATYLKLLENPKVLRDDALAKVIEAHIEGNTYAKSLSKLVGDDPSAAELSKTVQYVTYKLNGTSSSDIAKDSNLLRKALAKAGSGRTHDGNFFRETLNNLKKMHSKAVQDSNKDLQQKIETVRTLALINMATYGKTVPGPKCGLVVEKFDVVHDMQLHLKDVLESLGVEKTFANGDQDSEVFLALAERTFLRDIAGQDVAATRADESLGALGRGENGSWRGDNPAGKPCVNGLGFKK